MWLHMDFDGYILPAVQAAWATQYPCSNAGFYCINIST